MTVPNVGDRIELLDMPDDPLPIEPGMTGTVTRVNELSFMGITQVSVKWDGNRSLLLCIPPDSIRILERRLD